VIADAQPPAGAMVVSCEVEKQGPSGARLVAVVALGDRQYRYRVESSRSWRYLGEGEIAAEQQRLIDLALWGYLRDFTGEIDARYAARPKPPPSP